MKMHVKNLFLLPVLAVGWMLTGEVAAQTFKTLHNCSALNVYTNNDGANPYAGLILSSNTLYGTAASGGNYGYGVVFVIDTDGTGFTNLYSFTALVSNTN